MCYVIINQKLFICIKHYCLVAVISLALQSDFNLDFTKGGTTDYARVRLKQDLSQFTVCFWMMSNDAGNYGTPFSYATQTHDNAITLTDYNG